MTLDEALGAALALRDGEGGRYAEHWNFEALMPGTERFPLLHIERGHSEPEEMVVIALQIFPYLHPSQALETAVKILPQLDFEPSVAYVLAPGIRAADGAIMLLGFDLLRPEYPMMEVRCD
jgi:hypothetical protein